MKPQLKSSRAARDLIKEHEPFRPEAVRRGRRWVVGFGHSITAREGVTVSREDAELLLIYDVLNAEQAIDAAVGEDLPAAVRDALVSFACSIGPGAFKVSDVARLAKAGRHREAANALETWVRAEEDGRLVVSERLTRRRAAEKALYLEGLAQKTEAREEPESAAPRPHPIPPVPEPARQAREAEPAEEAGEEDAAETPAVREQAVPAGDGDTRPRLGPLVDLEIEFEDPPEVEELAARESEAIEAAEPALERALGEAEDIKDTPEPEAVESLAEPEDGEAPEAGGEIAPAPEPEPEMALDKGEQDEVVQKVMARMAREIADTMRVDTSPPGEPVQLGYSFLEPVNGQIELEAAPASEPDTPLDRALGPDEDVKSEPEPEARAEPEAEAEAKETPAEPESEVRPGPSPVYASVTVGPAPVRASTADATPPRSKEAPAEAPGFSGEVGGVGRPADIEEIEAGEEEELHPELVAGREARDLFRDEEMEAGTPPSGRWMYVVHFAIGAVLTGFGAWDLIRHFDIYQREGFNEAGPVSLGMGIILMIASAWFLSARRKRPEPDTQNEGGSDGFSGET